MSDQENCRLYILSPVEITDADAFAQELDNVFSAGDVASFQLRLKECSDEHILKVAQAVMPVCIKHDVAFIINDRADLAKTIDADGVHLGQEDGDIRAARELLGFDKIIGVTCHDSRHLAFEAGEAGADYVAFGAFFDSSTKDTQHRPELDIVTGWAEATEIPVVAIGGMTPENCGALVKAGAHFIAASGGVWTYPTGPAEAVKAFNKAMAVAV